MTYVAIPYEDEILDDLIFFNELVGREFTCDGDNREAGSNYEDGE